MEHTEPKPRAVQIVRAASEVFKVDHAILTGQHHKSTRVCTLARWSVMILLKEIYGMSKTKIGQYVGGVDHSTVNYGLRQGYALMATDPKFSDALDLVRQTAMGFRQAEETAPRSPTVSSGRANVVPKLESIPGTTKAAQRQNSGHPAPKYNPRANEGREAESPFVSGWWVLNDKRFRKAMLAAHPERFAGQVMEAAE